MRKNEQKNVQLVLQRCCRKAMLRVLPPTFKPVNNIICYKKGLMWVNATAVRKWRKWIHLTTGWRRDEHGTHKHAHGSWILCSASHVRSKTMHSLRRAPFDTSQWLIGLPWLNVIDLTWLVLHYVIKVTLHYLMLHRCEIHSAMELSRMALLGCRLVRREAAHWQ